MDPPPTALVSSRTDTVSASPARAIFRAVGDSMVSGARALIVANRTLPWERDLREIGTLRQIVDQGGYKIIEVTR